MVLLFRIICYSYSGFHMIEDKSNQHSRCWERGHLCPPDSHSSAIRCNAAIISESSRMNVHNLIPHLERFQSYDQALREFRLQWPEIFNIADMICRSHRDAVSTVALFEAKASDDNVYTFGGLDYLSDKFANVLKGCGVKQGEAVAVILPQSAALVIAHLGILKLGGIVAPFATDANEAMTELALKEISPRAAILSPDSIERLSNCVINISSLDSIFVASDFRSREEFDHGYRGFWREVYRASPDFTAVETAASAPAFIFPPVSPLDMKSVVHAHRLLIGQLPAFEMSNNFDLGGDTIFYTPSQWSSLEMLSCMLYPALVYGRPVIACADAEMPASSLFKRREVTNLFISEDNLNQIPGKIQSAAKLRNIVAFNSCDHDIKKVSRIKISHVYAKRETGALSATCDRWFDHPSGFHGRAIPGSRVELIDSTGSVLSAGMSGQIAAHKDTASLFLSYFNDVEETSSAFIGDWFLTGKEGFKDENGDLWIRR